MRRGIARKSVKELPHHQAHAIRCGIGDAFLATHVATL